MKNIKLTTIVFVPFHSRNTNHPKIYLKGGKVDIPLEQIQFSFVRSSGPGGQNVNKVASKAVLRWNAQESNILPEAALARLRTLYPRYWTDRGEIVITSQRTRDALKNKQDCLDKLREMVRHALIEPKRRIPTRPTKGSVRRRLETKARNAKKKRDRRRLDDP